MHSQDLRTEAAEPLLLMVDEAARLLRVGRSRAYELAHDYLTSGGTTGLPVILLGPGCFVCRDGRSSSWPRPGESSGSATPQCRLKRQPLPAEPARHTVVLTTGASEVRRALTPTAWIVLEELLLRSNTSDGECSACESVRALARSLGLSKDTVASAIRQLRHVGLVTATQRRTEIGTFESGSYVIAMPAGLTLASPAPAVQRKRARVGDGDLSQLSLAIES